MSVSIRNRFLYLDKHEINSKLFSQRAAQHGLSYTWRAVHKDTTRRWNSQVQIFLRVVKGFDDGHLQVSYSILNAIKIIKGHRWNLMYRVHIACQNMVRITPLIYPSQRTNFLIALPWKGTRPCLRDEWFSSLVQSMKSQSWSSCDQLQCWILIATQFLCKVPANPSARTRAWPWQLVSTCLLFDPDPRADLFVIGFEC